MPHRPSQSAFSGSRCTWTGDWLGAIALGQAEILELQLGTKTGWGMHAVAALSSNLLSNSRTKLRNLPVLEIKDSMNFFKVSRVCQGSDV